MTQESGSRLRNRLRQNNITQFFESPKKQKRGQISQRYARDHFQVITGRVRKMPLKRSANRIYAH